MSVDENQLEKLLDAGLSINEISYYMDVRRKMIFQALRIKECDCDNGMIFYGSISEHIRNGTKPEEIAEILGLEEEGVDRVIIKMRLLNGEIGYKFKLEKLKYYINKGKSTTFLCKMFNVTESELNDMIYSIRGNINIVNNKYYPKKITFGDHAHIEFLKKIRVEEKKEPIWIPRQANC